MSRAPEGGYPAAGRVLLAGPPQPLQRTDDPRIEIPIADWRALLDAVAQRVQRLTAAEPAPHAGLHMPLGECMDALRQLNASLDKRLLDAIAPSTELAAARSELAVTRAALARARARARLGRQPTQHPAMHDAPSLRPNGIHCHPWLAGLDNDRDGFKRIDDEYGHGTGNATPCIVAPLLARAPTPSVQPSLGIATVRDDGMTAAARLQRADTVMFRARSVRRACAFFDGSGDP